MVEQIEREGDYQALWRSPHGTWEAELEAFAGVVQVWTRDKPEPDVEEAEVGSAFLLFEPRQARLFAAHLLLAADVAEDQT